MVGLAERNDVVGTRLARLRRVNSASVAAQQRGPTRQRGPTTQQRGPTNDHRNGS
jgi:hypothetical protein